MCPLCRNGKNSDKKSILSKKKNKRILNEKTSKSNFKSRHL